VDIGGVRSSASRGDKPAELWVVAEGARTAFTIKRKLGRGRFRFASADLCLSVDIFEIFEACGGSGGKERTLGENAYIYVVGREIDGKKLTDI